MQTSCVSSARLPGLLSIFLFAAVMQLSGCSKSSAATAAAAPPPPPVGVAAAVTRPVRDADEFTGRMEATEAVSVRPRVGGYIDKVHFQSGQEVKKGQLLISIDPLTYRAAVAQAQGELAAAQSRAALARSEKVRGQTLIDQKAISQQEFDQLNATLLTAAASVQSAQAALQTADLNLGYTEIRAPIAGRVSRALITEGNLVIAGQSVLTTIESLDQMYAYFDASEEVYLRFARQAKGPLQSTNAQPVAIQLGLLNETGYPHTGSIESFDNRLSVTTGAVRTRAIFDNSHRDFTPGLYARLHLVSGNAVDSVLIPERAIGTDQSKKFVMVVGQDDVASYRNIQVGSLHGGMRTVTDGLKSGERVIVDGLQRVRPGAKVAPEMEKLDDDGQVIVATDAAAAASSANKR